MEKILILSDNLYFCLGIDKSIALAQVVGGEWISASDIVIKEGLIPIIRVSNIILRQEVIKKIQSITNRYVVTMDEMYPRCFFKLGYVLYCGNLVSLTNIVKQFKSSLKSHFAKLTDREFEVLKRLQCDNLHIAEELNLSIKTISHYKLCVLEKLRIDIKSNINLLKMKLTLDNSYLLQ